ncbi:MAG: HAD family phosphatase [Bacteroidota bacterium]
MAATDFDTIIFDLGGVLIDWDPRYVYRQIFDSEEKVEWFLKEITYYEWNVRQDAGRPLAEATAELVSQFPEWKTEIEAYYGRWEEMLGGPIAGTVDILRELKEAGTHRLLALTNWSAETFPVALERYDFLGWFEGIVVSGEEKMVKPDPRFYQILLDRYNVDPTRAIFTDDSPKNITGATDLGITAFHFTSPEQLRTDLESVLGY